MNNLLPRRHNMQTPPEITKNYFNINTQNAIIEYNTTPDANRRSKIYSKHIQKSFETLVDHLIYNGKFYRYEESVIELKGDAIAYLIEQMHLYKEGKGKAFSYFNVVCHNYLKNRAKTKYQELLMEANIECADYERNVQGESQQEYKTETMNEFLFAFVNHVDKYLEVYFKKKRDQHIVCAVLTILKRRGQLEHFNKKALYIMIREMTDANTICITRIVNVLRQFYFSMYKDYEKHETITQLSPEQVKQMRTLKD